MFANNRGRAIILLLADLTLVLLMSPLLSWSFLLLQFLSFSLVLFQNMPHTIEEPQYYWIGAEVYFQPPF